MAIPGDDRDVILGDDSPAMALLRDLKQRFPEIPPDVVSSTLKKNNGNMSRCVEELELLSSYYMYDRLTPTDPPLMGSSTTPNASSGMNRSGADFSSHLRTPERGIHPPNRGFHTQEYHLIEGLPDVEGPSQLQYTSWASLDTRVPGRDSPHARRERTSVPSAEEQRHVSLCTVDMRKKPMRTESVPASHGVSGAGDMPAASQSVEDPVERPGSALYNRTTSNGLERALHIDPSELPFEPRPGLHEDSFVLVDVIPTNKKGHGSQWTFTPSHIAPAEVQSPSQIATSYQLDLPKPSNPASTPQRASQSTTVAYVKSTDRISLQQQQQQQNSPASAAATSKPSVIASVKEGEERTASKQDGSTNSLRLPSSHLPRSSSKEQDDQAYTEALLKHQKARYERLIKELDAEKKMLSHMRKETSHMEEEVTHKRQHRGPFPTSEEITKLREEIRQLQIDNECMSREIESHKSQGLMDPTQASSFYGNIDWTGAPGPVPPIPQHGNTGTESAVEPPPPPPSYETVMEGQMWSCSSCTLLNHPALDKCECCESPRD